MRKRGQRGPSVAFLAGKTSYQAQDTLRVSQVSRHLVAHGTPVTTSFQKGPGKRRNLRNTFGQPELLNFTGFATDQAG